MSSSSCERAYCCCQWPADALVVILFNGCCRARLGSVLSIDGDVLVHSLGIPQVRIGELPDPADRRNRLARFEKPPNLSEARVVNLAALLRRLWL
jgi:hypothetical protein